MLVDPRFQRTWPLTSKISRFHACPYDYLEILASRRLAKLILTTKGPPAGIGGLNTTSKGVPHVSVAKIPANQPLPAAIASSSACGRSQSSISTASPEGSELLAHTKTGSKNADQGT